jgi:sugar/nucleoside kinase (ribokinase family)
VIVGHVCIDHNVTEHATYHGWGSSVMYIDSYFQTQLGIKPKIVTSYGPDFIPYAQHVELIPAQPQQTSTLLYRNVITSDLRTWYCEHAAYAVPPEITPEVIEALEQADICIIGLLLPNYPAAYIKQLLEHTRPDCIKGMVTQGYLRNVGVDNKVSPRNFPEASEILPLLDIAVLSDEDHPRALELAHDWKQISGVKNIILTQGPKGATILNGGQDRLVPTVPLPEADIVDSVGCGDVFAGSLIYEYYKSRDMIKAVKLAHATARAKLLAIPADAQLIGN